ncbi:MAG: RNase adapter RapZ, partial [Desulfobacterota bacterium]|nr:RNase adapter RapZ [Thermodesulfobacteriota bacterium]
EIFQEIRRRGYHIEVLFLDAGDEVLARRFSQTRRQHPLGEEKTLSGNIQLERKKMAPIQKLATTTLDTTGLNVHQLRDEILRLFSRLATPPSMVIHLVSFGYKYGLPFDADLVMDVRFLPNPFFVSELKELDGNQPAVVDYIMKGKETGTFLREFFTLVTFLIPAYQKEGKANLTIAIGCTGGRHRSVAIVNALAELLKEKQWPARVRHRDIEMG